jgi:hypothetical protein
MNFKPTLLAVALLAMSGMAAAEPLKVKAGLWETTTATQTKGAKQPTNLEQLTPEQRAKVDQKLGARGKSETHTTKACLKAEQIASGEAFMGKSHHGACTHKPELQTAADQKASVQCRGTNPMTGTIAVHATDEEHMNGRVDMTYGPADKQQLVTHSEMKSRWLGAECGKAAASTRANPHAAAH